MLLLAFDTAGPDCSVALARSGEAGPAVIASHSERIGRGHAERLMPMIDEVLDRAGLAYSDLGRIAVATGPGSFTGVRVGVAAARALALALDIDAVGVGSLQALARSAGRHGSAGTAVAALDARRGEIYVYAEDAGSGAMLAEPFAASAQAAALRLGALPTPIVLTGSGAPLLHEALTAAGIEIAGTAESPDISDVALLGLTAGPGASPAPLYLRGADAKPQIGKGIALQ